MGWGDPFKKLAKKVKKAVNKVADKVADVVETAGNKAQEAATELADDIRDSVPILGPAVGAAVEWAGAVVSGLTDLAGAAIKAVGSITGSSLAGVLLIFGGYFKDGLREMISGDLGGFLLVLGKVVSLVQIAFGAETRKRRLTDDEVATLRNVFRTSVALFNIRIIEGNSGVFDFTDRPFTMGNTIYMKTTTAAEWDPSLVHETTHVWQYQNSGSSYSSEALGAQMYYEHVKSTSAYDWWDPEVNHDNMVWEEWNREAQARFIEDVFTDGQLTDGRVLLSDEDGAFYAADGTTTFGEFEFRGQNYTPVARQAVRALRGEVSVRDSLDEM